MIEIVLILATALRYAFRREFAPYIGLEWASQYGGSADYARAAAESPTQARAVTGLRFWW